MASKFLSSSSTATFEFTGMKTKSIPKTIILQLKMYVYTDFFDNLTNFLARFSEEGPNETTVLRYK